MEDERRMMQRIRTELLIKESNDRDWRPNDMRRRTRDKVPLVVSAPHFNNTRISCTSDTLRKQIASEVLKMVMDENQINEAEMLKTDAYYTYKDNVNKLRSCMRTVEEKKRRSEENQEGSSSQGA